MDEENNANAEKTEIIETKEKILNSLGGELEITKLRRMDWTEGVAIDCEFMKKGVKGTFEFIFMGGQDYGIENLNYEFEKEEDEELWDEITEWVEDNVEFEMSLKFKGEDVKY